MKKIFSVQVENRSGVLSKISGLFARRCYNIDSLAVGETEVKDVSCMTRELLMMRLKYNSTNRRDIVEICAMIGAQIVDMSTTSFLIQLCDTPERADLFIRMMTPFGINELARTGILALPKCTD